MILDALEVLLLLAILAELSYAQMFKGSGWERRWKHYLRDRARPKVRQK